jgi:hypothetical protein
MRRSYRRGDSFRVWRRLSEPDPDAESLAMLEEPIGYQYDAVVTLRLEEATAIQWDMRSDAFFLPYLLGYGAAEGAEEQLGVSTGDGLLMEPSDRGFRSDGAMPAGDYLPCRQCRRPMGRHVHSCPISAARCRAGTPSPESGTRAAALPFPRPTVWAAAPSSHVARRADKERSGRACCLLSRQARYTHPSGSPKEI